MKSLVLLTWVMDGLWSIKQPFCFASFCQFSLLFLTNSPKDFGNGNRYSQNFNGFWIQWMGCNKTFCLLSEIFLPLPGGVGSTWSVKYLDNCLMNSSIIFHGLWSLYLIGDYKITGIYLQLSLHFQDGKWVIWKAEKDVKYLGDHSTEFSKIFTKIIALCQTI